MTLLFVLHLFKEVLHLIHNYRIACLLLPVILSRKVLWVFNERVYLKHGAEHLLLLPPPGILKKTVYFLHTVLRNNTVVVHLHKFVQTPQYLMFILVHQKFEFLLWLTAMGDY